MTRAELIDLIRRRESFLCVGLDSDIHKIPSHLESYDDPVFEFNRRIIDATKPYCVAYKLNTAFYEAMGADGWATMEKTFHYIGHEHLRIADAKRGDIGNTCNLYARAFYEQMKVDAVTLAPYMGRDSILPFLEYENKFAIVLGLTSNESARDFELEQNSSGEELYKTVIRKSAEWGNADNMMYVVGATQAEMLKGIRKLIPDHFLLVPGIGAQGGSLEEVCRYGMNRDCGLLVNSSRGIIYAGSGEDFDAAAGEEAWKLAQQMQTLLNA